MAKGTIRSIRAHPEFWEALDAYAEAQHLQRGPALVHAAKMWIEHGDPEPPRPPAPQPEFRPRAIKERASTPALPSPATIERASTEIAKATLAVAEAKAAHLAKPKLSERQRVWRAGLRNVPVGPVPRAPGSMLKAPKKGPRR